MDAFRKLGIELTTFNKSDSIRYTMKYIGQIFVFPPKDHIKPEMKYDFYFLGRIKNRGDEINDVKEKLQDYHNLFLLVGTCSKDVITYFENVENVKHSRCLIEINQKNQEGLTIRALEALFFDKKLLTNNDSIKNAAFYNPANIYILGCEKRTIPDFLSCPMQIISDDIKKMYDINYWIKNL